MAGIPSIVIDQGYGVLGIEVTHAQMKITTPRPEMTVERIDPEMTIEQQRPEFNLNWKKPVRNAMAHRSSDYAKAHRNMALNAMKLTSVAKSGKTDEAGSPLPGGLHTAHLARRKTLKTPQVEINLGTIERSSPEVAWTPGTINVNWTRGSLSIDWVGEYMPQVVIDPPFSIDIYLREKPYIKIMVDDGEAPDGMGSFVDIAL